jgi:hypothetical protein
MQEVELVVQAATNNTPYYREPRWIWISFKFYYLNTLRMEYRHKRMNKLPIKGIYDYYFISHGI